MGGIAGRVEATGRGVQYALREVFRTPSLLKRANLDGSLDGLIHVTADAAQLQARRMLNAMIGAEQA